MNEEPHHHDCYKNPHSRALQHYCACGPISIGRREKHDQILELLKAELEEQMDYSLKAQLENRRDANLQIYWGLRMAIAIIEDNY